VRPLTCSGTPIPLEELRRREQERLEKKNRRQQLQQRIRATSTRDVITGTELSTSDDVKTDLNVDENGSSPNHARQLRPADSVSGDSLLADDRYLHRRLSVSPKSSVSHERAGDSIDNRVKTEIESPPPRGTCVSGFLAAPTHDSVNDDIRTTTNDDDRITDDVTEQHYSILPQQLQLMMRQNEQRRRSPMSASGDVGGGLGQRTEVQLLQCFLPPDDISMTNIKSDVDTSGRLSARSMRFSIASLLEIDTT